MHTPKYLNSLPNVKEWGIEVKENVKYIVLNLTFKADNTGSFKIWEWQGIEIGNFDQVFELKKSKLVKENIVSNPVSYTNILSNETKENVVGRHRG